MRTGIFLSCLYGSEQMLASFVLYIIFLSCLYGSEHLERSLIERLIFLSCLYGSEHTHPPNNGKFAFSKLPVRQ